MGTLFPCVLAAFQQWERRSHAFPLEMTPDPYVYHMEFGRFMSNAMDTGRGVPKLVTAEEEA